MKNGIYKVRFNHDVTMFGVISISAGDSMLIEFVDGKYWLMRDWFDLDVHVFSDIRFISECFK